MAPKRGDYQKMKDGVSGSGKVKKERFNDAVFINYELDKAAQAACKAWPVSADALFQSVLGLVERGYAITLKWDTYSDSHAAFMRFVGQGEPENAGLILTGRGSTPEKALKQMLYKHFEVMAEVWEFFVTRRSAEEIDD